MPEPINLFALFTRPLNQLGARYMVCGSVAVIVYGEPRLTHDVDLVVFFSADQLARLPDAFPPEFFYCPPLEVLAVESAREQRGHFNVIHHQTGYKADFYLCGRDPLHVWGLRHARALEIAGERFSVAPPEYVILRKLEYYREGGSEKHLRDIRSILSVSADQLNHQELTEFIRARKLESEWQKVILPTGDETGF